MAISVPGIAENTPTHVIFAGAGFELGLVQIKCGLRLEFDKNREYAAHYIW